MVPSLVFLVVVCGSRGCTRRAQPAPARVARPHIVFYLVDTLRRDHLGVYGYERDTSPCIDAFARDAVVYDNAYAPSPWTRPSTATLLSGLEPLRHGAVTRANRISEHIRLLGEYLQPLGYRTEAFTTNPNTIREFGFGQGFDRFHDLRPAPPARGRADEVFSFVRAALREPRDGPLFFYVHTIDPHFPYEPPPPFADQWPASGRKLTPPPAVTPETAAAALRDLRNAYDGEVAFADHWFGRLIDELQRLGLYDDTLVLFVSDHGEEFREHGRAGHGNSLYQESMRVPLLIKYPHGQDAGTRAAAVVTLCDVVPTVLACLDQPAPTLLDGTDLRSLPATAEDGLRAVHLDIDLVKASGDRRLARGMLRGPYKFIHTIAPAAARELYDLSRDPAEQQNLIDRRPDLADQLAADLAAHVGRAQPGVHLRIVNGSDQLARSFSGRLITAGRFCQLQTWEFEPDDRVSVAANGTTLEFQVKCRNIRNPGRELPLWIVDEDRLSFEVDPPGAQITFQELRSDDATAGQLFLGPRRVLRAVPTNFPANDDALRTLNPAAMFERGREYSIRSTGGVYLFIVPHGESIDGELDPETIRQLIDLGYLDG